MAAGNILNGPNPLVLRACDGHWEPLFRLCFHCMVLSVGYLKYVRNLTRRCISERSVCTRVVAFDEPHFLLYFSV